MLVYVSKANQIQRDEAHELPSSVLGRISLIVTGQLAHLLSTVQQVLAGTQR
jgi:hypothetical protein